MWNDGNHRQTPMFQRNPFFRSQEIDSSNRQNPTQQLQYGRQPNRPQSQMYSQRWQQNHPHQRPQQNTQHGASQNNQRNSTPLPQRNLQYPLQNNVPMPQQQHNNTQMSQPMPQQQHNNTQISQPMPQQQYNNPQTSQPMPQHNNPQMSQPMPQQHNNTQTHPQMRQNLGTPNMMNQPTQGNHSQRNNLPSGDGIVKFEPVDENLLKQIRGHNPQQDQVPEVENKLDVTDIKISKVSEKIGKFVQNEKNSMIYYKNLSERSPNPFYKNILSQITENSKKHMDSYNSLYNQHEGLIFNAIDETVNTNVDFHEGIRLAILEENKMFQELTDIYDNAYDANDIKILNSLLHKKSNLLNHLYLINQNFL